MVHEVLCFFTAKPGKEERVDEVLSSAIESIRKSEPDTLSYHIHRFPGEEANTTDYVAYGKSVKTQSSPLLLRADHQLQIQR
jgi:quinol monooxygenase YgiN